MSGSIIYFTVLGMAFSVGLAVVIHALATGIHLDVNSLIAGIALGVLIGLPVGLISQARRA